FFSAFGLRTSSRYGTTRRPLPKAINWSASWRSTRDLVNVLDAVGKAGASFKSLADAWADTSTAQGRLMVTVLGAIAEFARELIRARTGEGRQRVKANGVRFGRPAKLTGHQMREARTRWEAGETVAAIARSFACSHKTVGRVVAA